MIIAAVTAWTGLGLQASITVPARLAQGAGTLGAVAHLVSYFTVLANALAAVSLTVALLLPRSRVGRYFARPDVATGMTLSMVMIGAVYGIFLRKTWPAAGLQHFADMLLHYVAPSAYALYWALAVPRFDPRLRALSLWLVFPACYGLLVVVRGWATSSVPYFFLDIRQWGLGRVLITCGWIGAGFLAMGLLLIALDQLKPRTVQLTGRSQ